MNSQVVFVVLVSWKYVRRSQEVRIVFLLQSFLSTTLAFAGIHILIYILDDGRVSYWTACRHHGATGGGGGSGGGSGAGFLLQHSHGAKHGPLKPNPCEEPGFWTAIFDILTTFYGKPGGGRDAGGDRDRRNL